MTEKKTALYEEHIKLKAKMVSFGGWLMPVQYEGIIKEHNFTRESAGLFDVSHMGELYIKGKDSLKFLESLVPQKISDLRQGRALYCQLTNDDGGIEDDMIVYNSFGIIEEADYLVVVNASRIEDDFSFIKNKSRNFDVEIINKSDEFSMLALQGPKAKYIIEKMGIEIKEQPEFFSFKKANLNNIPVFLMRSGYTGEDGFELLFKNEFASVLWTKTLSYEEVVPVGLGARDTLRLEAALPLYGHELNEYTTPVESSLGFFIPKDKKEDYSGKNIILSQKLKQTPLRRKLFAFMMEDKVIAREGYEVFLNNKSIGKVTSGAPSPTLGKNIGFCMIEFVGLDNELVSKLNNIEESIGICIQIMVRNKLYNAKIVKKPFIKKKYDK